MVESSDHSHFDHGEGLLKPGGLEQEAQISYQAGDSAPKLLMLQHIRRGNGIGDNNDDDA